MRIRTWAGALFVAAGMTAGTVPALAQGPIFPPEFSGDLPEQMWRWMQEMVENGNMPALPAMPALPEMGGPQRPANGPSEDWTIFFPADPSGMEDHRSMSGFGMALRSGREIGRMQAHLETLAALAFGARMADRDRNHRLSEAEFMEAAAGVFRMLDLNRDRALDLGDAAIAMELFAAGRGGHASGPGIHEFSDWSDHQMPGVYHLDDHSGGGDAGVHHFNDNARIEGPDVRFSSDLDTPGMQFTERNMGSGPAGLDRGPSLHIRVLPFAPGFWGDDNGQVPFEHRQIQKSAHGADPAPRDMRRGR